MKHLVKYVALLALPLSMFATSEGDLATYAGQFSDGFTELNLMSDGTYRILIVESAIVSDSGTWILQDTSIGLTSNVHLGFGGIATIRPDGRKINIILSSSDSNLDEVFAVQKTPIVKDLQLFKGYNKDGNLVRVIVYDRVKQVPKWHSFIERIYDPGGALIEETIFLRGKVIQSRKLE